MFLSITRSYMICLAALQTCPQVLLALPCAAVVLSHPAVLQDKVQDVVSQQLDAADTEAVMQELQQLENQALQDEMAAMPAVPELTKEQKQQQAAAAAAAAAAARAEAGQLEEELPSVPDAQVGALVLPERV